MHSPSFAIRSPTTSSTTGEFVRAWRWRWSEESSPRRSSRYSLSSFILSSETRGHEAPHEEYVLSLQHPRLDAHQTGTKSSGGNCSKLQREGQAVSTTMLILRTIRSFRLFSTFPGLLRAALRDLIHYTFCWSFCIVRWTLCTVGLLFRWYTDPSH